MELQDLQGRIYFLAGQLEEAKVVYKNALGEIERVKKEQAKSESKSVTADSGQTILAGEPA